VRILAGTSGYSYPAWKGPFYPEGLPAQQMLRSYAERLPAVEINNTFYRLPRASVLEAWAAQVPEGFRFVLKASRRITHFKRLKDTDDETGYLLRTAGVLGPRLGAILFQLPPNLAADAERLDRFLALLPEGTRAAFEFRHPSWLEDPVTERLRARGCALVAADVEGEAPPRLLATAPWGYLRLRRPGYAAADLAGWLERIRETGWGEVYVFFKHEDEAAGPRLALELLALAGRRTPRRTPPPRRQTGT
jgi:uncharacterized protein YecE (DUF72 family)